MSLSGVFAVDKPLDWTSHDVVAVTRRAAGMRKVGHGGTLDPQATGVLPVLLGEATRFFDAMREAPKVYAAIVRFGRETATDDREGATTREGQVPARVEDDALTAFRGAIQQVPPAFAAVKVGGKAAYRRARDGEVVELAPRSVTIERIEIADWRAPDLALLVVCSSGTYIRALARDLGRSLGSAGHLGALRRLAVGALDAASAVTIEHLRAEGAAGIEKALRPADDELLALPERFRVEPATKLVAAWEAG